MPQFLKQYLIAVGAGSVALSIAGFVLRPAQAPQPSPAERPVETGITTVDSHGCEVTSSYVWCEPKQKCLRLWEEKCEGIVPPAEQP